MFTALSREYGWTPDQIRWITLQELEIYSAGNQEHRKHIDSIETSLEKIRRVLYSYFGVKESGGNKEAELEQKIQKATTSRITKEAKDAWLDAGMPSPAGPWLENYMRKTDG